MFPPSRSERTPSSSKRPRPTSATILPMPTSTLIGAALRLGNRPLSAPNQHRLLEQLTDRADAGDATARMTLVWLASRLHHDLMHDGGV